jgi:molybdenum cofactor sulfurtransferase
MGPDQHYMDYTGSSLYCNSQLEAAFQELRGAVFGNPHSANPSSELASERVEAVRDMILRFFNADPGTRLHLTPGLEVCKYH